jgi:hypothetical protein
MKRKFSLFPSPKGSRYSLTQEGEERVMEFQSLRAALQYARLSRESPEATVVLFDFYGREAIEFRLDLPEPRLRSIFRKPTGLRDSYGTLAKTAGSRRIARDSQ